VLCFLLFQAFVFAKVIITVPNVDERIMQVTYLWEINIEGEAQCIFPNTGYDFAKGPIKVISVIEKNTEQELEYEVVEVVDDSKKKQAVKVFFPTPIPKGGSFAIEVTVTAKTDFISIDKDGRYVFEYETGHYDAFFVLPKGHAITYCNYPVLVYEKTGSTVVLVRGEGTKNLIFKTRSFD